MLLNKKTFFTTGVFFSIVLLIHLNSINKILFTILLNFVYENSIPLIGTNKVDLKNYKILDTREKNEFLISHLPNAKWIGNNINNEQLIKELSTQDTVIVYCSVGYRSEKVAEKLMNKGYRNIYNLKGGIIEWVNKGKKLISNGKATNKIHPYSKLWELWIIQGEITYDLDYKVD